MRAATRRALEPGSGSRRLEFAVLAGVALLSVVAAHSIPGMSGHVPKALVIVLGLAGGVILLTLSAEQLFFGWLLLAPLLQESAGKTHLGHLLSLALYTAPPLVFAIKLLFAHGPRPARQWFDFLPGIYVAFIFASLAVTASAELKSGAVGTVRGFYQNVALGPLVYYAVSFWRGRPLSTERLFRFILLASAVEGAMSVVEWATGWNLWHDTSWQVGGDVRSIATLSNPALTGAFIGTGIVVALSVLCWGGPVRLRRLAVWMLIVGVPGLYATKTRGPILATLIAAVACLLLSNRSRVVGIGVIALAALVVVNFWPQIRSSSVYQNRIDQQGNVEARLVLQEISFKLAEERPIFGWGYDSFDRVKSTVVITSSTLPLSQVLQSTSHDTFLTILVEYGAIGLVIFLLPWAGVVWRALRVAYASRARDGTWIYVAALGSITVIEITAGTLDYRFYSFVPMLGWLFLGIVRRQITLEPGLRPLPVTQASAPRLPAAEPAPQAW